MMEYIAIDKRTRERLDCLMQFNNFRNYDETIKYLVKEYERLNGE